MAYKLLKNQPKGLEAGELGLQLDDGTFVAVKVSCGWQANNAGAVFTATCRHIDSKGESIQCPNGNNIHTSVPMSVDHGFVDAIGEDIIKRELMLAVLGEPQNTREVDGETVTHLMLSEELLNTANIRKAIAAAKRPATSVTDLTALLGL